MSGLAGVVLAGGRGVRLGEDKALVSLGGQRLVDRVVAEVATVASPVVVAAGSHRRLTGLVVPQVADPTDGAGPLGGIVAGLRASAKRPAAAVVAVDQPGVSGAVLRHLADVRGAADVALPEVGGHPQHLHAVYATATADAFAAALAAGERSVRAVLRGLAVRVVTEAELRRAGLSVDFAVDIDTPADLRRWRS